jgi:hypothetical protein
MLMGFPPRVNHDMRVANRARRREEITWFREVTVAQGVKKRAA